MGRRLTTGAAKGRNDWRTCFPFSACCGLRLQFAALPVLAPPYQARVSVTLSRRVAPDLKSEMSDIPGRMGVGEWRRPPGYQH
jgi:hypothetical protein